MQEREREPDETTRGADEKPGCVLVGVGLLALVGVAGIGAVTEVLDGWAAGGMHATGASWFWAFFLAPFLVIIGIALLVAAASRSVPSGLVRLIALLVGVLDLVAVAAAPEWFIAY